MKFFAKIGTMRKPQEFSAHPIGTGDKILVQSDKSIGVFDFRTGKGVLNTKGNLFPHLAAVAGAKPYTFPADFVAEALKQCPALGSKTVLGGGAVVADNTIEEF